MNILIQKYGLSKSEEIIKKAIQLNPEEIIKIIKSSELLGRGGAYFPTGIKWDSVRNYPSNQKFIICNAEEGEPFTYKDRFLLKYFPYKILDGMIICSITTGVNKGYIYINEKYSDERKKLEDYISIYYKNNLLGKNIFKTDHSFTVEVIESNGRYITGEETSILNLLEGKRPVPRLKPPYPTEKGFFDCPTVVNNVETFCFIPHIIYNGSEWFKSFGIKGSYGTKLISITIDGRKKGIFEVEFGKFKLSDILKTYGQIDNLKKVKYLLPSATGEVIFRNELSVNYDIQSFREKKLTIGTGGIIVLIKNDLLKTLLELMKFFMEESCGFCVPCRIGTKRIYEKLLKITSIKQIADIEDLILTLNLTSRCLLGKACVTPLKSLIERRKKWLE